MRGLPDALRADGEVGLDHAERDANGVLVLTKLEVLLGLELEVVSLLITRVAILEQFSNPYCDLDARGHGYRVDAGPNAARKRARDTMAPLNNQTQTSTYPLIPHREFPTVVTD
jgi:hypothetical protein